MRTEGIYTIMITLAIASAFYYFTHQNYTIFNGFSGFNARARRRIVFGVDWRAPVPFYYLTLFCAAAAYVAVVYVVALAVRAGAAGHRATMPAAWRRSASTSPPTGSRPMPSRR